MRKRTAPRPLDGPRDGDGDPAEAVSGAIARASGIAAGVAVACLGLAVVASQAGFADAASLAIYVDARDGGKHLAHTVPAVSSPDLEWDGVDRAVVVNAHPEPATQPPTAPADVEAAPADEEAAPVRQVVRASAHKPRADEESAPVIAPEEAPSDGGAGEPDAPDNGDADAPAQPVTEDGGAQPPARDEWREWWQEQGERWTDALRDALERGGIADLRTLQPEGGHRGW